MAPYKMPCTTRSEEKSSPSSRVSPSDGLTTKTITLECALKKKTSSKRKDPGLPSGSSFMAVSVRGLAPKKPKFRIRERIRSLGNAEQEIPGRAQEITFTTHVIAGEAYVGRQTAAKSKGGRWIGGWKGGLAGVPEPRRTGALAEGLGAGGAVSYCVFLISR
jgi:hypothetical protein